MPVEVIGEFRDIPVHQIEPHPNNPNRGDVEAIRNSMTANGFYGVVTVRELAPDRYQLLVGEHRWRVAVEEGVEVIPARVVVADDVLAVRIMLSDNETAKRSHYDNDVLVYVLDSLESLDGTGFDLSGLEAFEEQRAAQELAAAAAAAAAAEDDEEFDREYGLVILCTDEAEQRRLYEEFSKRGLKIRVATI